MDITGKADMHLLVTDTLKKGRGVDQKTSEYLVCPPFSSCSMTHLLCIELIRLLIVACGMLSHTSSMAVWSGWILAGTRSIGDMSGESAGHGRTGTFSASRNYVQILAAWGCALSCWNVMAVDKWHNNGLQDLVTVSLCIQTAIDKTTIFVRWP